MRINPLLACAVLGLACSVLLPSPARAASIAYLHQFDGANGGLPRSGMAYDGQRLYGTAEIGGNFGNGVLYAINSSGQGFEVIHHFSADSVGFEAQGTLLFSSGRLIGTTTRGGLPTGGFGAIYSMDTNGGDLRVLHNFADPEHQSLGGLIEVAGRLYGVEAGNAVNYGSIFSLRTDGSDFQVLHNFTRALDDGATAVGPLAFNGSQLFGIAQHGGASDQGGVFAIRPDGADFSWLHSFPTDLERSSKGPLSFNGRLYGVTGVGGPSSSGTIFSLNPDGTDFQVLHNFNGLDGAQPLGELVTDGNRLFGTTGFGGDQAGSGVAYAINPDGSNFEVLYDFGALPDGRRAWSSMLLIGTSLYGTTAQGGLNDGGTIFVLTVPEPGALPLMLIGVVSLLFVAQKNLAAVS